MEDEVKNPSKSPSFLCVQYLISRLKKDKSAIKKDDLMKTVFKGRVLEKNYDKVMEDVSKTLTDIYGFSISHIDSNQFIIVNNLDKIPGGSYNSTGNSKYNVLLKAIILALTTLQKPIREGKLFNMIERLATSLNLNMDIVKSTVKIDFVRDQYLLFKATDETTAKFDPEGTSYWFSMGPRALAECDTKGLLKRVREMTLYNEENLINHVRLHTCLYDVFSSEYKNQYIQKEKWEEIGRILKVSADKCKSEWMKLQNCFLNAIRSRRNKTSDQSTKHWKYSQQMEFLLPYLENREVHSNLEACNDDCDLPATSSNNLSLESDTLAEPDIKINRTSEREKEYGKRKKSDYTEDVVQIMRENVSIRNERYKKKLSTNNDDVERFYLSMAKIAKRLPKSKEAELRMEVYNKVSEAELAYLSDV